MLMNAMPDNITVTSTEPVQTHEAVTPALAKLDFPEMANYVKVLFIHIKWL